VFSESVKVLAACADETRLRILHLLGGASELCVSDLVSIVGASQPKISRHLAYLRAAGLVRDRKAGLNVYYRLATTEESSGRAVVDAILASIGRHAPPPRSEHELEPPRPEISIELL